MSERLLASQRINKSRTFQTIFRKGNRFQGHWLNLWIYTEPEGGKGRHDRPKLAVMVSRKAFSKAVARNLWKRRLREVFRRLQHQLKRGTALIVQARRQDNIAPYGALQQEMQYLFKKAKILK